MRLEAASTALFHAFGVAALPCGLGYFSEIRSYHRADKTGHGPL